MMQKVIDNGVIYRITSPEGKKRVGYTTQPFDKRMSQYKGQASSENKRKHHMTDAIRKYGWEAFKKEIIIDGIKNFDLLCELEKHYIRLEATTFRNYGYNFESGGSGGPQNLPKEVLDKMRDLKKKSNAKKINDIIGVKYGKLTAIKFIRINRSASFLWRCDCGNEREILLNSVKRGLTTSCGCVFKTCKALLHKDVSGKKFNRLTLERFLVIRNGRAIYLCACDCGKRMEGELSRIKIGHVKSCGCLKIERRGENHNRHKIILNKDTGIFYFSISEAALSASIVTSTLGGYLGNYRKNLTSFIYV